MNAAGTPFVKLGGFNDLYNEDDDEDEDEDSDEDSDEEPPPQPAKKSGARKKAGFAEDTEDHNAEDKERVPGVWRKPRRQHLLVGRAIGQRGGGGGGGGGHTSSLKLGWGTVSAQGSSWPRR